MVDTFRPVQLLGIRIPPLENGDRLSRQEFERRYAAMPHLKKAELIEGIVYVPAALRYKSHAEPHGNLIGWLWTYKTATPGVGLGDNPTVRLDLENEPQPDAVLLIESGGQAHITDDDYIEGAPELILEIAASTVSIDLHEKKRAYRRNGVQEYLVWRVLEQECDWFVLQDGEYVKNEIDEKGILKSSIFPGLWLAVSDLLAGNMQQVLATLQQGLTSAEHFAFVQQLADRENFPN